jgi:hypothetical protein
MLMSAGIISGYLVIGDISGFTSYVASTELEHSQAVLAELLGLILEKFQPILTLAKVEGDAIFAHVPGARVARGETLLELLESTYVAFRDRVLQVVRHTTCECRACRAIPMLDLKFIVHYGDYIIQDISGIKELVGSDVNLLHRLAKNHVSEKTGWQAYILFTEGCLQQIGVEPEGMFELDESYEHLGVVKTLTIDLRKRYKEIIEGRRVFISAEEAHGSVSIEVPVPPPMLWEWLSDPRRRNQASDGPKWEAAIRPGGRTGAGASNHCAHGKDAKSYETVLDWRPFDYYTVQGESSRAMENIIATAISTYALEPLAHGKETRLRVSMQLQHSLGKLFGPLLSRLFLKMLMKSYIKPLTELMLAEQQGAASPGSAPTTRLATADAG